MQNLYDTSAEAASVLNTAVAENEHIRIGYSAGNPGFAEFGPAIDNYIGVDMSAAAQVRYFNPSGTLVAEKPDLTLIHELIHVLQGLSDTIGSGSGGKPTQADMNAANFDFVGDVLRKQNIIAAQMGYNDNIQVSYDAAYMASDPLAPNLQVGVNYSNGDNIDSSPGIKLE